MSNSNGKINLLGVLTFADESILELELGHEFYIEAMDARIVLNLLEKLGPISDRSFLKIELERMSCIDNNALKSNKIYVVKKSFKNIEDANIEVDSYLLPLLKIIRLFKECTINIYVLYYYWFDETASSYNVKRFSYYPQLYPALTSGKPGFLDEEFLRLTNFIKIIDKNELNMNFKIGVLKLALDYYDLSYYEESTPKALLDLSISLESLFNPNSSELRYRISRNAATLIGKDKTESLEIYKFVKNMYIKRSKLVHMGTAGDLIKKDEINQLRSYLRRSIKSFYKYTLDCRKSKKDLLDELELTNFGDSPVRDLPW